MEILLPPGQSIVGAPEGTVYSPIPGLYSHSRELLGIVRIQTVYKAAKAHAPEPGQLRHLAQHIRNLIGYQDSHINPFPCRKLLQIPFGRLLQYDSRALARSRHNPIEIHKGQLRQNQIVHFIERRLLERQIPPPVQIIQ